MELQLNKETDLALYNNLEEFSFFKEIVNTNSYTYDLHAIREIQKLIKAKFEEISCDVTEHFNEENIPLLEIHYGNTELVPVTLIGHSDCVQIVDETSFFNLEDNMITGSGVIDNKAAIQISYSLISSLISKGSRDNVHIRVLIYPSEERGSIGFEELSANFGKTGRYFLGLEPALEDESIINCRGGNRWYEFNFSGEEFHSGRIQEGQLNLGHYIMKESLRASELINSIEGVKFNLTHIESADETFNTTINKVRARFDLRFLDNSKRDSVHSMLENDFFKDIKSSYAIHDDCPAMEQKNNSQDLLKMYQVAIGRPLVARLSYGAADINYISNSDNVCLDGLGAVGGNMHGKIEYLYVDKLKEKTESLEKLILGISSVYN